MDVVRTTLKQNISLGLVLSSAMAWNTFVTDVAEMYVSGGKGHWASLVFALFITMMMVAFSMAVGPTKTKLNLE